MAGPKHVSSARWERVGAWKRGRCRKSQVAIAVAVEVAVEVAVAVAVAIEVAVAVLSRSRSRKGMQASWGHRHGQRHLTDRNAGHTGRAGRAHSPGRLGRGEVLLVVAAVVEGALYAASRRTWERVVVERVLAAITRRFIWMLHMAALVSPVRRPVRGEKEDRCRRGVGCRRGWTRRNVKGHIDMQMLSSWLLIGRRAVVLFVGPGGCCRWSVGTWPYAGLIVRRRI